MDLYDICGVGRDASYEEIKKSYQQKALEYHPDKQANLPVEELKPIQRKFLELQNAWTVLRNPVLKQMYDTNSDAKNLAERIAISQEVDLDDMNFSPPDVYTYPCRCGNEYEISESDLEQDIDIINCGGCSLLIKVLYEIAEEEEEEEEGEE